MATLEKIRSKSVLLFAIIIIALLAFILGDFLTSGSSFFGNSTRVAKVKGNKVEYQEYSNIKENLSRQNQNNRDNYDDGQLSQDALNQLLYDKLFAAECEDLGLVVTDEEITDAMLGANPSPIAQQAFYTISQQLGQPADGATIYSMMKEPVKFGLSAQAGQQLKDAWKAIEKDVETSLLEGKFFHLLAGLYTASNLDAQMLYNDNAVNRSFSYAIQSVNALSDEDVNVTDEDVKLIWQEQQKRFKLEEEVRAIDYILVPIVPSADDRAEAMAEVNATVQTLNGTPGTGALLANSKFKTEDYSLPLSQLSTLLSEARQLRQQQNIKTAISSVGESSLRAFLEGSKTDSAYLNLSSPTHYIVAKNLGDTIGVDQINLSFLTIDPTKEINAQEVADNINAGKETIASLAAKTADGYNGSDSISGYYQTVINQILPIPSFAEAVRENPVGKAVVFTDSIQGTPLKLIVKVNERTEAPVYHFAVAEYNVEASDATRNDITNKLATYVSSNSSADEFAKNAAADDYAYVVETAVVTPSSTRIGNASDSYQFVKWAMDAEKGKVSPMLIDSKQTYAIALAVKDIYEDEYLPWNSPIIYDALHQQALNRKKADKIAADINGKANSVEEYAKLMNVQPGQSNFNFNTNVVRGINNEGKFYGALAAAEDGKLVGPVKGDNSVIVFTVNNTDTETRPINEDEFKSRFASTFGFINAITNPRNPNLNKSRVDFLRGDEKITNEALKFIAPVGE